MASPLPSASMSEIGEIIADMDNNNIMESSDAPAEEPPTLHSKRFRIGSGNIIGKVTQFGIILRLRDKLSNTQAHKRQAKERDEREREGE